MFVKESKKQLLLHFFRAPSSFLINQQNELTGIELSHVRLEGEAGHQRAVKTNTKSSLECGVAFKSIGYKGVAIDGVPFDEKIGIVPNQHGCVLEVDGTRSSRCEKLFVTGWLKRGPSGIIGTNKFDAQETALCLVKNLQENPPRRELPGFEQLKDLLCSRHIHVVSFQQWQKLDDHEKEMGKQRGKDRLKVVNVEEMLNIMLEK